MSGSIAEKLLLYRLQNKHDPEAFGKLYDLYVERIYRFVYFKVNSREEAEDLTAEVFLKCWQYLQEDKEVKSFSGLLYRIARTAIIDWYRRRGKTRWEPLTAEIEKSDSGQWYSDLANREEAGQALALVRKLKQEYQEVITLRYVDGLSIDEIATIVGKGNIAVRVTLHRATRKLQQLAAGEAATKL